MLYSPPPCVLVASCFSFSTSLPRRKGLIPSLCGIHVSKHVTREAKYPPGDDLTYIPSFVRTLYVPLGWAFPTTWPEPLTSMLPRMSSGHAILPKSGGFRRSLRWTQPPTPAPPAPPWPLAPPAPEPPAPPPPPCLEEAPLFRRCCSLPGKNDAPEPRLCPPGLAKARAWLSTSSSSWPCSSITSFKIRTNVGFSRKVCGVGGIADAMPMATRFIGGSSSR